MLRRCRNFKSAVLDRDHFSSNRHPALGLLLEHDLFRKPVSTFRDHALAPRRNSRLPSLPAIGDGTISITCQPSDRMNAPISSHTSAWTEGSRTMPLLRW